MSRPRAGHPFLVGVGSILASPGSRRRVEVAGSLPGLELETSAVAVVEEEPITFAGLLEAVHEGILVTGTVRCHWRGTCRRCLEPASGELSVAVRELCVERGDEETTYALGHEQLDLEPIVHDACILELPLAPLCREGCLGLCPACGANRNDDPCGCDASRGDPRWSALRLLAGGDDSSVAG